MSTQFERNQKLEISVPPNPSCVVLYKKDWRRISRKVRALKTGDIGWGNASAAFATTAITFLVAGCTTTGSLRTIFFISMATSLIVAIFALIFYRQEQSNRENYRKDLVEEIENIEQDEDQEANEEMLKTGLHVLRAEYGSIHQTMDVTLIVANKINNNILTMQVTNLELSCDPHIGQVKTLTIEYMNDGSRLKKAFKEGKTVELIQPMNHQLNEKG